MRRKAANYGQTEAHKKWSVPEEKHNAWKLAVPRSETYRRIEQRAAEMDLFHRPSFNLVDSKIRAAHFDDGVKHIAKES